MKIKKISQSAGVVADVVNNLNSDSTIDALSAAAGKELNEKIDNLELPDTTVIEDNLTSTSTTSALSANQGKILNNKFDGYYNKSEVESLIKNATEITFTMPTYSDGEVVCTALRGMTFAEWVDSEYYNSNSKIYISNTGLVGSETSVSGQYYYYYSKISPSTLLQSTEQIFSAVYSGQIQGTCCFEAGSQVLVSLDGQTKNIEDIKSGDQVVSYDSETEDLILSEVTRFIIHDEVTNVAEVILENGMKVRMNEYHPILTTDGYHSITNYEGFETLMIGDAVITQEGISKIVKIIRYVQEPETMYNLSVDNKNHNYIVNGIVVHNAATCPGQ